MWLICLSSASLYLSYVVEHCYSSLLCRQNEAVSVSFLFYNLSRGLYSQTGWGTSCKVEKRAMSATSLCSIYHNFQTWTATLRPAEAYLKSIRYPFSECTTFFCHFQKSIQRIPVQWVWSLLFPEWPVTFFFTFLVLLIDHLGLKIHSHCVSGFLTSLHHCCMHFLT